MKFNLILTVSIILCIQKLIAEEVESDEIDKRQALFNGEIGQNTVNQVSIGAGFFKNGKRRIARQFVNQFFGPIAQHIQNNVTSGQAAAAVFDSIANFFNNSPVPPKPQPQPQPQPQPTQPPKQVVNQPERSKVLNQPNSNQNGQVQSNPNTVGQPPMGQAVRNNQSPQARQKKENNHFNNQFSNANNSSSQVNKLNVTDISMLNSITKFF